MRSSFSHVQLLYICTFNHQFVTSNFTLLRFSKLVSLHVCYMHPFFVMLFLLPYSLPFAHTVLLKALKLSLSNLSIFSLLLSSFKLSFKDSSLPYFLLEQSDPFFRSLQKCSYICHAFLTSFR